MLAPTNSIMLSEIDELAEYIYARYQANADGRRFIVGVAGIPGSGKSTLAYPLTEAVNRVSGRTDLATCVGGDGWHLSQAQLREMEVSLGRAIPRERTTQGSRCVVTGSRSSLRAPRRSLYIRRYRLRSVCRKPRREGFLSVPALLASREGPGRRRARPPTEPHCVGCFVLSATAPICGLTLTLTRSIIEGLYVHLNMQPWRSAAARLDERIWVETARCAAFSSSLIVNAAETLLHLRDEARERLVRRHLSEGVETLRENAIRRGIPFFSSSTPA